MLQSFVADLYYKDEPTRSHRGHIQGDSYEDAVQRTQKEISNPYSKLFKVVARHPDGGSQTLKVENMTGNKDWQVGYKHAKAGKPMMPPSSVRYDEDCVDGYKAGKKESASFSNGQLRAKQAIQNKVSGTLFENANVSIGSRVEVVGDNSFGEDARAMDFKDGKYYVEEHGEGKWISASKLKPWK